MISWLDWAKEVANVWVVGNEGTMKEKGSARCLVQLEVLSGPQTDCIGRSIINHSGHSAIGEPFNAYSMRMTQLSADLPLS
jgi:hypothetical protein